MKKSNAAVFATTFVVALLVSVSASEEGPAFSVGGEEACADAPSCHVLCDLVNEACVKAVKQETKVGSCFECCKTTERDGRLPFDPTPTRDELHQYMLDRCVFSDMIITAKHLQGFPRELHAAEAFKPKPGKIAEAVRKKYDHGAGSVPDGDGPRSANESACVKGCTYRTKRGMASCHTGLEMCLARCPAPTGGSACGKR